MKRLDRQIEFIIEIDKLKSIFRRSYVIEDKRYENSAEHSWHVSTLALLMSEYADSKVDLLRVVRMLLVHDIVEIDAGDVYFFDAAGNSEKAEKEQKAADRLFGLLPEDQAKELRDAWEEYEAGETPDARFAYALDRFIPLLHNFYTQGKSWQEHKVSSKRVLTLKDSIKPGSEALWEYAEELIQKAVERGYLPE